MFVETNLTRRACLIALDAHFGQLDKNHASYILHPMRVAEQFVDETLVAVALLHDVLEDSPFWTTETLCNCGMPFEVVSLVEVLTRQKDEQYFDYIRRVKENEYAKRIKLADLRDNLSPERSAGLTDSLLKRYLKAVDILEGNIKD